MAGSGLIDCCVHYQWPSQQDLYPYLSTGWVEYLGRPGLLPGGRGMAAALPAPAYEHPRGRWHPNSYPAGGEPPGSDPGRLAAELSDRGEMQRAVLMYDLAAIAGTLNNPIYGHELIRAFNDWTLDRWLVPSVDQFYGLVLAQTQLPDQAAAEIRRIGAHSRMVGVLLSGNGLGRPLGHPVYHPIYNAAAELGLPIVLTTGTETTPITLTHPTAGGLPGTFGELYALRAQSLMTHLVSIISQGLLERYRGLKVLAVGGGALWLPGWIWRVESDYRALNATLPWIKRRPLDQLLEQVRISTYSFRAAPAPDALSRVLGAVEGMDGVLCFGSGYPRWDADDFAAVAGKLPAGWADRVAFENADRLFRWPDQ